MGKKDKRAKKEVVDLTKFASGGTKVEDTLDWALDDYHVDETAVAQQKALADKSDLAKSRIMSKNVADVENFRAKGVEYADKVVPPDMVGPFVAFVKNLLTKLPEEDVRAAFITPTLTAEALKSVKLVSKEVSTFGFLEFETRENLQEAILLDGKTVRGRKMLVDIATTEQVERMTKNGTSPTMRGSPVFGRDTMGQQRFPSTNSLGEFSREAFGSDEAGPMRAPRSTTSPNGPGADLPVSRDMMGASQPSDDRFGGGLGGRGKSRASNVSSPKTPFSGGDFGNFRDGPVADAPKWRDAPVEQPVGVLKREASKDERPRRVVPAPAASGGNWRDTPAEVAPGAKPSVAKPAVVAPAEPVAAKKPVAMEIKKDNTVKSGLSFAERALAAKK